MSIAETVLPEFDQEMANTRKLLERVPEDKLEFKPHAKSMTLGRLAAHIAELPGWANVTLTTEVFNLSPGQQPYIAKSRQELLETFDRSVSQAREQIAAASDQELLGTWKMTFGPKTIVAMPRTSVLRSFVMNHLIHHRAQLGVYLRVNDIEIPGFYGPSADENKWWEAQAS